VFSFRARARSVWNFALTGYRRQPVRFLEVTDPMLTPEQAAEQVLEILKELQEEHGAGERSRTA